MQQTTAQITFTGGLLATARQLWTPHAVSLHSYMLQARWMQIRTPAVSRGGNTRCHSAADMPSQSIEGPPQSPDISLLSPELRQQWHVDRNMHLGAIQVKPNSDIKAVWKCIECPVGQPHVWTTSVQHRNKSSRCPYCSNRRLCLHNCLATIAPDVARYWDLAKNDKSPQQVLAGSQGRAEWKCPTCKYEWKAHIRTRVRARSGCPKCSRSRCEGNRGSQPTFAEAQPAELAEWDHERNEAAGFYPQEISLGSAKKVHWICSCCPRGQSHRWTAPPHKRIADGTGCPACAGKQVCVCNSLESLSPSMAAEFDVDKNGFGPSDITVSSHKEVWWRNGERGSWKQVVDARCRYKRAG